MSKPEEQAKREKELKDWQRQHMEPAFRPVHNAMINVRIEAYREAIRFLEDRIQELEADKVEEQR